MDALIEFGKILIPASVVLYAAYLMVRTLVHKEVEMKKLEVRGRNIDTVLPIRLQAYERMTLFLERISPENLLIRLNTGGLSARDLHQLLLQEIRNEFNHNVTQQVYMSVEVWDLIRNAKEDLTVMINEAAGELHPEAGSMDLTKKIFEKKVTRPVDAIGFAVTELKKEIQRIF